MSDDDYSKEQLRQEIAELRQRLNTLESVDAKLNQLKREQQESERRYQTLMSNLPGLVYRCRNDTDWTMEFLSEGCFSLTGYKAADLINNQERSYASLIHPDDQDQVWQSIQQALAAEQPFQIVYRIRTRDSEEKWVWEQGRAVSGQNNETFLEGFITDISHRQQADEMLRRSEERFHLILENTRDLVSLHAPDGTYVYLSRSCEQILGYAPHELVGTTPSLLLHPDDTDLMRTSARETIKTGEPANAFTFRYKHKSGEYIWLETHTQPVKDGDAVVALVASTRDVTERENARAALRIYNQRLAALHAIDRSILSAQSLQTIACQAGEIAMRQAKSPVANVSLFDYDNLEVLILAPTKPASTRWTIWDRYPLDQRVLANRQQLHQGLPQKYDADTEPTLLPPGIQLLNGQRSIYYLRTPLVAQDVLIGTLNLSIGKAEGLSEEDIEIIGEVADQLAIGIQQASLRDKAQQHTTQLERRVQERTAELQQTKEYIEAILNNTSDAMVLVDTEGKIQRSNRAFNELFGYDVDAVYGQHVAKVIAPDEADLLNASLRQIFGSQQPTRLEIIARPSGTSFFIADVALAVIRTAIVGEGTAVFSLRDITPRKQIEDELRQALGKEKELRELKERFVSMVSHEFRNPLAGISSTTELLKRYTDSISAEKKNDLLDKILRQVNQLTDLLNDTLFVSQSEIVGLHLNPASLDLPFFCMELVQEIQHITGETHQIVFSKQGSFASARMDQKLLRHMITNLLSNAVKYSPEDSRIQFDLESDGETVTIAIQDEGIGIPEEDQKHLFEVFHRAANVGHVSGTGLGLVIAKHAVDAHRGRIHFESEVGSGTRFTVTLPLISL